jgi:hypothetical protein
MIKRLMVVGGVLLALLFSLAPTSASAAPVAPAALPQTAPAVVPRKVSHDLVITHKSNDGDVLLVCDHWGRGPTSRRDCDGRFANLPRGKNTRDDLGWEDADGAGIKSGKSGVWSVRGPDKVRFTNCTGHVMFWKESARLNGGGKTLYAVNAAVCGRRANKGKVIIDGKALSEKQYALIA